MQECGGWNVLLMCCDHLGSIPAASLTRQESSEEWPGQADAGRILNDGGIDHMLIQSTVHDRVFQMVPKNRQVPGLSDICANDGLCLFVQGGCAQTREHGKQGAGPGREVREGEFPNLDEQGARHGVLTSGSSSSEHGCFQAREQSCGGGAVRYPVSGFGDVAGTVNAEGNSPAQELSGGQWGEANPEYSLEPVIDGVMFDVQLSLPPALVGKAALGFESRGGFDIVGDRAGPVDFGEATVAEEQPDSAF
jgi:hypothetical protein